MDKEFLPVEFILPRDLAYLQKLVSNNGVIKLVHRPLGSIKHNFFNHMTWRETKVFYNDIEILHFVENLVLIVTRCFKIHYRLSRG